MLEIITEIIEDFDFVLGKKEILLESEYDELLIKYKINSYIFDDAPDNLLWYWVDYDDEVKRYLGLYASNDIIENYLNKNITLKELILSSENYFIIDEDNNGDLNYLSTIKKENIPEKYLPYEKYNNK